MEAESRHWHSASERYTGGDSLVAALHAGWTINEEVASEVVSLRGGQVQIYRLNLERDGETRRMHVISNPYVNKLMAPFLAYRTDASLSQPTADKQYEAQTL